MKLDLNEWRFAYYLRPDGYWWYYLENRPHEEYEIAQVWVSYFEGTLADNVKKSCARFNIIALDDLSEIILLLQNIQDTVYPAETEFLVDHWSSSITW